MRRTLYSIAGFVAAVSLVFSNESAPAAIAGAACEPAGIAENDLYSGDTARDLISAAIVPVIAGETATTENGEKILSGTLGESISWTLDTDTGRLIISGTGNLPDNRSFDHISIRSVEIGEGITGIGARSFYKSPLTDIFLPGTLKEIGYGAFLGCASLNKVSIPAGVSHIGEFAFENCPALASVSVDPANTAYSAADGVLYNYDQSELILRPAGKTETSFTVPDGVEVIGEYAFDYNAKLIEIYIPGSVTKILSETPFLGASALQKIEVAQGNPSFSSQDGNLYDNTESRLIRYAPGKEDVSFTADGVAVIDKNAFQGAARLSDVTLPESVGMIGYKAFDGCTALNSLTVRNPECVMPSLLFDAAPEGLVIYGYDNSTAKDYADAAGILFEALQEKDVASIEIASLPKKTKFATGDAFNSAGLVIKVFYADGSYVLRSRGFTCEGFDSSSTGFKTVIVSYGGAKCSYEIEIVSSIARESISEGETRMIDIIEPGMLNELDFIPAFSGEYAFYSSGSLDTCGGFLGEDAKELAWNDDSDEDQNFYTVCALEKGKTYILASALVDPEETGTFSVTIERLGEEPSGGETESAPGDETESDTESKPAGGNESENPGVYETATRDSHTGSNGAGETTDGGLFKPGNGQYVPHIHAGEDDDKESSGADNYAGTHHGRPKKVKALKVKNIRGKKVKITWKKAAGADGYRIQYARDKKFRKKVKTVNVSKATARKKVIKKLKKKTYYFRVRAWRSVSGKRIYGVWSRVKRVKVKK